jgi:hypothetical protein
MHVANVKTNGTGPTDSVRTSWRHESPKSYSEKNRIRAATTSANTTPHSSMSSITLDSLILPGTRRRRQMVEVWSMSELRSLTTVLLGLGAEEDAVSTADKRVEQPAQRWGQHFAEWGESLVWRGGGPTSSASGGCQWSPCPGTIHRSIGWSEPARSHDGMDRLARS